MFILLLCFRRKTVERVDYTHEVDYSYDMLSSGMQANQKINPNNQYYVLALTSDRYVDGVQIETYFTRSPSFVALVYSARSVSFRYCKMTFENVQSSAQVAYAIVSESVTLYYSTVLFNTTYYGVKIPENFPKIISVTNSNGTLINESTIAGKLTTLPCQKCALPNQSLADSCFDCPFGSKKNGLKCDCQYSGSTINPNVGRCENIYTDIISSGSTYYFAVCQSNKQITIKTTRAFTATQVTVLKDDSCGITNLFIDGTLSLSGSVSYASGLVRYATKNMQYVFSSLSLLTYFTSYQVSLICNEVTTAVTFTGITLNGKLNVSAPGVSSVFLGGVLSKATTGQTVTLKALRLFGFILYAAQEQNIGLVIGNSANASISISDLFITRAASTNLTTIPVSSSGYDYTQVQFPCKNTIDNANLKTALMLQLYMKQYTLSNVESQLLYYITRAGGVIGVLSGGTMTLSDSVVNVKVNGSYHSSGTYIHVGMIVGAAELQASLTIDNVYCNGSIVAYRQVGVIGILSNSRLSATIAANFSCDGDQYGGFIGETYYSNITSLYLAINAYMDEYWLENGIFGWARYSNITVNKAFGYFQRPDYALHNLYASSVKDLYINGVYYAGGNINTIAGLSVNNCTG